MYMYMYMHMYMHMSGAWHSTCTPHLTYPR